MDPSVPRGSYAMLSLKKLPRNQRKTVAWVAESCRAAKCDVIRDALNILLVVCILTGCAPASALQRFQGDLYGSLQLCWLLLCYIWLCLTAYLEFITETITLMQLKRNLYLVESLIYLAHVAFILQLSFRWRHKLGNVIDQVVEFDVTANYSVDCQRLKRFVRLHLLVLLIFTCVAGANDFCFNDYNLTPFLRSTSTYIIPNIITSISFAQYYLLLYGVARRLIAFNQSLKLVLKQPNISRASIQQLRWQHACLQRFTRRVNQTYGVAILFIYVGSFINLNLNIFLLYKYLNSPTYPTWPSWAYTFLWQGMQVGKMFTILYFNHRVQQQRHCLQLVTKARCENANVIETLNHFKLQLYSNVREYVVCGLIVLDFKFITALLMATANILIFMVQYDITYAALSRAKNETYL